MEYGPNRPRVQTAPQPVAPLNAQATDALITMAVGEALRQAIPEMIQIVEAKIGVRFEVAKQAQESAELTLAKRTAESAEETAAKWVAIAKRLGVALGLVATVAFTITTTAIATYRDAVDEVAAPAAEHIVEAKIPPIEQRMVEVETRIEQIDKRISEMTEAVDALVESLRQDEPTKVVVPSKRKAPK